MKLYFKNIYLNNDLLQDIDKYKIKSYKKELIFSNEGIFQFKNKKIYKLKPNDNEIINTLFDNNYVIIDNSYFEIHHESHQIPFYHFKTEEIINLYKLSPQNLVSLNIVKNVNSNKIEYFYINIEKSENLDDLNNHLIKEDIISFLSYLK